MELMGNRAVPPVGSNCFLSHITDEQLPQLTNDVLTLMGFAGTSMGRATHYTTKEEQAAAEKETHRRVFSLDRGLYAAILAMDGVTDFSRKRGITALLGNSWSNNTRSSLSLETETRAIHYMIDQLQINKKLDLFVDDFLGKKINNTRSKKIVIAILGIATKEQLDLWAVKYKRKFRLALEHAWGKKRTTILKYHFANEIAAKRETLKSCLPDVPGEKKKYISEFVSFVLGNDSCKGFAFTMPLVSEHVSIRRTVPTKTKLPTDVFRGLVNYYHRGVFTEKQILEMTKSTMSAKQTMRVQAAAEKHGVEIEFDPLKQGLVELYIYAFERGMTDEMWVAIKTKAKQAAQQIPIRFGHVGILVDDSGSMFGTVTQKKRPMAAALATKDVFMNLGEVFSIETVSGKEITPERPIPSPYGKTGLAKAFIKLLKKNPDAIFVITDGYENAPEGRFAEVLQVVRKIGINIPVYQLNPVLAAETKSGIRGLSPEVPQLPVSNPAALGLSMVKSMIENDSRRGLVGLMSLIYPKIQNYTLGGNQRKQIPNRVGGTLL